MGSHPCALIFRLFNATHTKLPGSIIVLHYIPLLICFQIFNSNTMIDDFCSEARVSEDGGEDGKEEKCLVYGRKKEKDIERSGFVHIFVRSSHDLQFL